MKQSQGIVERLHIVSALRLILRTYRFEALLGLLVLIIFYGVSSILEPRIFTWWIILISHIPMGVDRGYLFAELIAVAVLYMLGVAALIFAMTRIGNQVSVTRIGRRVAMLACLLALAYTLPRFFILMIEWWDIVYVHSVLDATFTSFGGSPEVAWSLMHTFNSEGYALFPFTGIFLAAFVSLMATCVFNDKVTLKSFWGGFRITLLWCFGIFLFAILVKTSFLMMDFVGHGGFLAASSFWAPALVLYYLASLALFIAPLWLFAVALSVQKDIATKQPPRLERSGSSHASVDTEP
jgi:hypothetical protein